MSGFSRKQRRTEARREYERFTKLWREEMRLVGLYGQKTKYKRPTFSEWYAEHQHELGQKPVVKYPPQEQYMDYLGLDPWAEQIDPAVKENLSSESSDEGERGVMTIDIAGPKEG